VAENQVLNKYSGTGPLYKYLRNETSATEFADHNTELADQVLVMTKVAMHDTRGSDVKFLAPEIIQLSPYDTVTWQKQVLKGITDSGELMEQVQAQFPEKMVPPAAVSEDGMKFSLLSECPMSGTMSTLSSPPASLLPRDTPPPSPPTICRSSKSSPGD
jgi:hypothetical protein